jgi:hypothetical protein
MPTPRLDHASASSNRDDIAMGMHGVRAAETLRRAASGSRFASASRMTALVVAAVAAAGLFAAVVHANSFDDEDWGCFWAGYTSFPSQFVATGVTMGEDPCTVQSAVQLNYSWNGGSYVGMSWLWENDGYVQQQSPGASDDAYSWHRLNVSAQGLTNFNYTWEVYY